MPMFRFIKNKYHDKNATTIHEQALELKINFMYTMIFCQQSFLLSLIQKIPIIEN